MEDNFFLLQEKFKTTCLKFAERVAVTSVSSKKNFTFQELFLLSQQVASRLIEQKIAKGDRVAIILENCPEWLAIYFGILFAGAVAVPLDPQTKAEELNNFLKDCQAKIVITADKLERCFKIKPPPPTWELPKVLPDDTASILYTSGTTAIPKGVILTHKNFSANFQAISKLKLCNSQDSFLSLLPFFHAYAFMSTLIFPLFLGAKIVFPTSLKSTDLTKAMQEENITMLVGVPELFYNLNRAISERIKSLPLTIRLFVKFILSINYRSRQFLKINLGKIFLRKIHLRMGRKLRFFVSGGARLEPKIAIDLFKLGFTVLEGYGLTETSPIVSLNLPGRERFGSVGCALPGVNIKIENPNEQAIGEVAIKGENVFKGYYNRPDETKDAIRDGWFYSGDLGFLDKQNYLYLTGRSKEVIVLSSGKNIYPEEIEASYSQSPVIKELCVLDVADEKGIVSLQALVVPNFTYFEKQEGGNIYNKIKWVFENVSAGLPAYKRISGFTLIKDDLPRTRLGKIKRYAVKERYLEEIKKGQKPGEVEKEVSGPDLALLSSSIGKKIIEFLKSALSLKHKPQLDDHLELDLGVDSLTKVEIVSGLEKMFHISIPDKLAQEITNVRQMILKLNDILFTKSGPEVKAAPLEPSWDILLATDPPEEIKKEISLRPSILNKFLTLSASKALFLIFKIFWRLKVKGKQNLPAKGNFVLYANHASYLDGPVLAAAVPFKAELGLYFIGWREIFQHPAIKWANKMARLVPIDSSADLINALKTASFILRNQKSICIFPEGQRTIDGGIKEFKKGIGILVKELRVPVVPVVIKGTFESWPRTKVFPNLYPLKIIFGKAIYYDELIKALPKESKISDYELIASFLRDRLIELSTK